MAFWTGLRVQPILSDEVQTFKALITVHKVLQEGHPTIRDLTCHLEIIISLIRSYRPLKKLMARQAGLRRVQGQSDQIV